MNPTDPNLIAVDTVLRYAINSAFSAMALHFGLSAEQTSSGSSYAYALACGVVAAAAWAWGIYRSRPAQKAHDVASMPGTVVVTSPEIAAASPNDNVVSNAQFSVRAK